ncbi:MAG: hypothetical protein N2Z23_09700 [Pyrinomonadaceae bacterium]|nr:hypothetical protein [Pyrinomonadaceae bacterium]MCX7640696.1 hypothetical protein [Pyrinomonadaceae bacterium]MDW8305400.1 hypothetical protein [Acidobacteriota bacterium]
MTFYEALLIYISIGFPFGVHYVFSERKVEGKLIFALKALLVVLLWFLYAMVLLFRLTNDEGENRWRKLSKLQSELEMIIAEKAKDQNFSRIREVLEAYVGLTEAVNANFDLKPWQELMKIANHSDPGIGTRCLQRRNQARIQKRQAEASRAFIALIAQTGFDDRICEKSLELTSYLKDEQTLLKIEALLQPTEKLLEGAELESKQLVSR